MVIEPTMIGDDLMSLILNLCMVPKKILACLLICLILVNPPFLRYEKLILVLMKNVS